MLHVRIRKRHIHAVPAVVRKLAATVIFFSLGINKFIEVIFLIEKTKLLFNSALATILSVQEPEPDGTDKELTKNFIDSMNRKFFNNSRWERSAP